MPVVCYDCKASGSGIRIRQCEYHLCDDCDTKRCNEIKQRNQTESTKNLQTMIVSNKTKSDETGLSRYVNSLKSKPSPKSNDETVVTPNDSATIDAATPFPIDKSPSDHEPLNVNLRCSCANCKITSPDESRCSCSICSKEWHVACANLKKPPAKSTKWICPNCKNVHALMKTLQKTVVDLQKQIELMAADQKTLHENQNILREENSNLKKELDDLKRTCDPPYPHPPIVSIESDHVELSDAPSRTLIIGDSMLRDLNDAVFENALVKSISGAKMTDVFIELHNRTDLATYRNIIIHAGTNDVSSDTPPCDITTSLEAIITLLMVEAPLAYVYISAVCPRDDKRLNHHIMELNGELKELATRLDCDFIDAGTNMIYRNGTIDWTMFKDGLHLSERGNLALINTFKDSIGDLVISPGEWITIPKTKSNESQLKQQSPIIHKHDSPRGDSYYAPKRREYYKNDRKTFYHSRQPSQNEMYSRNRSRQKLNFTSSDFYSPHRDNTDRAYTGCYNCGLKNHNQSTCYYQDRLCCRACNNFGHKERYCGLNQNYRR